MGKPLIRTVSDLTDSRIALIDTSNGSVICTVSVIGVRAFADGAARQHGYDLFVTPQVNFSGVHTGTVRVETPKGVDRARRSLHGYGYDCEIHEGDQRKFLNFTVRDE